MQVMQVTKAACWIRHSPLPTGVLLHGSVPVLVVAPIAIVCDAILPLCTSAARHFACILVPGSFLRNMHPARAAWLAELWQEQRIGIISRFDSQEERRDYNDSNRLWIVTFASPVMKRLVWTSRPIDPVEQAFDSLMQKF